MITAEHFPIAIFLRRYYLPLIIFLLFFSGLRFSDGSMLLAISKGAGIKDPAFANASAQYVFDSPLKVFLLRHIPSNVPAIALTFLLLAGLPVLNPLLLKERSAIFSSIVVLLLLPTMKLSFQNVGLGDGLVVFSLLLFLNSDKILIKSMALLTVSLWHPQQSVFMYMAIVVGEILYSKGVSRSTMFAGLIFPISFFCFLLHRSQLGFEYASRWDYMKSNAGAFLSNNILRTPVFILPLSTWIMALEPKILDRKHEMMAAIAFGMIIYSLGLFTTDLSRVFFLIMLPIFYYHARATYFHLNKISERSFFALILGAFCTPIVSWSGLDIFLWTDLFEDFCKWGIHCFAF